MPQPDLEGGETLMNQASTRSCRRHEWRREGRRTVKESCIQGVVIFHAS